jgi:hypothetical protein
MTDQKGQTTGFSTCLENAPFAEMMQKMMGQQGIGSLCAEMMKKAGQKDGNSCINLCAEMMQTMMKRFSDNKLNDRQVKKEE